MDSPISIDLPVRATLIAPNTPGSRVPSHGTTMYGEMYAIDFVVIDPKTLSLKPYRSSLLKYLVMGLPLKDFYGWGQEVYAPSSGVVVEAVDGIPERDPVSVFRDLKNTLSVTRDFEAGKAASTSITGNRVIMQCDTGAYCLLAHLRNGSVRVRKGQRLGSATVVGELGHSGNSTMPHLHMQFVDSLDFASAKGLPFTIRSYATYTQGKWARVRDGLPRKDEIFRPV